MSWRFNTLIVSIILVVAIMLRFYHMLDIPFTHDEFSALFRTHFNSFAELLEKGIKTDGHPAGIQVLLYYYTKIFGYTEWVVKLPFIISGIVSVYLIYLIGKKWFGVTTGLICAAFLASLEFPVMYSQIARPYTSGLLFSLLMVYSWHKAIFESGRNFHFNLLLYIIFSTCCAYNHYFSLLFAIIVGFTGLYFIKKHKLRWYLIAGITILFLFLPYFRIFLYQLHLEGLKDWLGKPDNNFLVEHIKYIFHFSWWMFFMIILIIGFGIYENKPNIRFVRNKFFVISFIWFLFPFLTGFLYSILINPVLQYSCLLFSFPFLLLLLFAHLKELSPKLNLVLVSVILLFGSITLIYERDYYTIFYNSTYQRIVEQTTNIQRKYGNSNVKSIVDSHKNITRYYIKKEKLDSNFIWYDTFRDKQELIGFLSAQKTDMLTYGCVSGDDRVMPFIIRDYYPYLIDQQNYFNGIFYVFGKTPLKEKEPVKYAHNFGFEDNSPEWTINYPMNIFKHAHSGKYSYKINHNEEFGPVYEAQLRDIIMNKNDYIDISCWCYSSEILTDVKLVITLKENDRMISWMAVDPEQYRIVDSSRWFKVYYSVKLSDIKLKSKNAIMNVYIWNPGKKNFATDDFSISQRDGNPVLYGLFQKL